MEMKNRVVVAIDGPAGAGKSTLTRRVAGKLGFVYIDSGAMYRAVALEALRTGTDLDDEARLERLAREARIEFEPGGSRVLLDGEDVSAAIRAPEISPAASRVSVFSGVRRALVEKQREMGAAASVVMEGRDIGSVVFPDAEVKIYLDADPAVRAERRVREMEEKGQTLEAAEVEREIRERDRRDSTRADSPLVRAPDAVYVDTTSMSVEEVEQAILEIVRKRIDD
ncbi:MAG: (d)CMP kinase [Bryobacteraceae bacterium]|jgi:cytidylate kinase